MTPPTDTQSLRIERTMKAPAERVYRAFLDPEANAKFRAPTGCYAKFMKWEPRVGGAIHYTLGEIGEPEGQGFIGTFVELKEFSRIRYTEEFETDMAAMKGLMEITITFEEVEGGTRVVFEQSGIPSMIPLEHAQGGYSQMLDLVTALVEADAK